MPLHHQGLVESQQESHQKQQDPGERAPIKKEETHPWPPVPKIKHEQFIWAIPSRPAMRDDKGGIAGRFLSNVQDNGHGRNACIAP